MMMIRMTSTPLPKLLRSKLQHSLLGEKPEEKESKFPKEKERTSKEGPQASLLKIESASFERLKLRAHARNVARKATGQVILNAP